jgi:hypothetical protein
MRSTARQTRENRTITVDFQNEATYCQLLGDGKAFVELVLAFILSLGFQLKHKATCGGGGCLTRHSHYVRVRLGGVTIWRLQCTTCRAVFTVLPHFVLRYRQMHPDVARNALLATHGGLSLELCAVIGHISPMALYRLVCALGHQSFVSVLTRCGLPLPTYFLADEKHSHCLTEKVYLPTIVCGRVVWHLGYTEHASAAAFTQSYQEFQHAASQQEPSYRVRGILTDGFDSTTSSMRTLFPGARLGNCLRHAINKLPKKLAAIRVSCPQGLALAVPRPALQGAPAEGLAGVCAGPAVTPLCRPRRHHGGDGQRRARTTMVPGQESGLVCGARRPPDASDQHPAGSGPQRHRPETVHDEGLPSSRWEPTGVSHGTRTPVQPGPLPASRQARWPLWGGSRRRESPDTRLAAQSPNPHVWRLSMSGTTLHH